MNASLGENILPGLVVNGHIMDDGAVHIKNKGAIFHGVILHEDTKL
jgi:hypothetical protein